MSEKEVANIIGGKLVKNSGRGQKKGDIIYDDFVIDLKETTSSITITDDMWNKVALDAASHGMNHIPALFLRFKHSDLLLVVMNYYDWRDMFDRSRISNQ